MTDWPTCSCGEQMAVTPHGWVCWECYYRLNAKNPTCACGSDAVYECFRCDRAACLSCDADAINPQVFKTIGKTCKKCVDIHRRTEQDGE